VHIGVPRKRIEDRAQLRIRTDRPDEDERPFRMSSDELRHEIPIDLTFELTPVGLLADLRAAGGDERGAATAVATLDAFRELAGAGEGAYDRILVRFDLDHGRATGSTLAAAKADLAVRSDAGGHDLVAWALHRLGRSAEAGGHVDAALATGAADARLLFHAGAIDVATGARERGRERLAAARELGPALDPVERDEALALLDAVRPSGD
jgi:hypothetical protein